MMNPFPGPKPYRAADRKQYPGRDELANRLEGAILASRCVTVHGPSGAGKSSLMQAQVLPRLEDLEGGRARVVCVDGWPENEEAIDWLAREFYGDLGFGPVTREVVERGNVREVSLRESVLLAAKRAALGSSRLVIVYLDQIEQLLYPSRSIAETNAFFETLDELAALPLPSMRIVLSLRDDYLGKLRDRLRDKRWIFDRGFRIGPLTVRELTESMSAAAAKGDPPQQWSNDNTRQLMMQVRVKGQPETDDAEAQAAFAQIVCRALFAQRAQSHAGSHDTDAEAIVQHYLESTLTDLGDARPLAELVLEDLVTSEGGRTLRTEEELRQLQPQGNLAPILEALEDAAVLQAAQHHGSRYFQLGHDWLSRRLSKRRNERKEREAKERRQKELEIAKRRRIEAEDQTLMAGFLALVGSDPGMALKLLLEVRHPEKYSNWVAFANNALDSSTVHRTLPGNHVVFSPDGKRVLVGANDAPVRIWNVDGRGAPIEVTRQGCVAAWSPDGARVLVFPYGSRGGQIHSVIGDDAFVELEETTVSTWQGEFSPDGKHILASSYESDCWVFDSAGKIVVTLQAVGDDRFRDARFLRHGLRVLTLSGESTLCVWDSVDHWTRRVLDTGAARIHALATTTDGLQVIAACADGLARAFPLEGQTASTILGGDKDGPEVGDMLLSADGQCMVVIYRTGLIRIFRFDCSAPFEIAPQHRIKRLSLSPTGEFLAVIHEDGEGRIWCLRFNGSSLPLCGHRHPPDNLSWSSDGRLFATGDNFGCMAKLWCTAPLTEQSGYVSGPCPPWSADYHVGKNRLVVMYADHTVSVHSLPNANPPQSVFPVVDMVEVVCSPTGERFFGRSRAVNAIYLYSMDGTTPPTVIHLDSISGITPPATTGTQTARWYIRANWSPDGTRIAVLFGEQALRIFRADGDSVPMMGEAVHRISEPPLQIEAAGGMILGFTWHPDGKHLVVQLEGSKLHMVSADGTSPPVELYEHATGIHLEKCDPSGRYLALTTADGFTGILSMDGSRKFTLLGKCKHLRELVWSKYGTYVAHLDRDQRINVFCTNGHRPPLRFEPRGEIVHVSFIKEDRQLMVLLRDGSLSFWNLEIEDLQQALRDAHTDNVPPDVRVMFLGESEVVAEYKFRVYESQYGRVLPPEGSLPED